MDEKTLRSIIMDYYLDDEILYKRLFDGTLLRLGKYYRKSTWESGPHMLIGIEWQGKYRDLDTLG